MVDVRKDTIWEIEPYMPGKSSVGDGEKVIKLSSNENSFGMSPMAVEAAQKAVGEQYRYPDGGCHALREAIAARYGLEKERIVCGAGSDELISLLCDAYAGEGDEVVYSEHGFLMYPIAAQRVGAKTVKVPEENYRTSVKNMLAAVTDATRVMFIANPNNPTGSYLTAEELRELRLALPDQVMLVVDGAYAEYATVTDYEDGKALVKAFDNVVMTRTFSKIYGMGGLRLGWCYASKEICDVLHRVRGPFNVSAIAQNAGVAAMNDEAFEKMSREHNARWIELYTHGLTQMGLKPLPTIANFIAVEFPRESRHNAEDAYEFLLAKRIIVRKIGAYGMEDFLRITIGTDEENDAVLDALQQFLTKE